MKYGYISAHKLDSERSKSFAVSISLQNKAIGTYLASKGLQNIPQVSRNKREIGQNHDSFKTVSPTLSVLK